MEYGVHIDFYSDIYCAYKIINYSSINFSLQSRSQTAVHLVSSRQTGTATNILRALLAAAGKDIRVKADGVSINTSLCVCVCLCLPRATSVVCRASNWPSYELLAVDIK